MAGVYQWASMLGFAIRTLIQSSPQPYEGDTVFKTHFTGGKTEAEKVKSIVLQLITDGTGICVQATPCRACLSKHSNFMVLL